MEPFPLQSSAKSNGLPPPGVDPRNRRFHRDRDRHRLGQAPPPILFFDAHCGLCNGLIRLLGPPASRRSGLRLEALTGDVAGQHLSPWHLAQDSLWLLDKGKIYGRSTAVLRLMGLMGWPWRLALPLLLLPRPLRDGIYGAIAKRRQGSALRWGGDA